MQGSVRHPLAGAEDLVARYAFPFQACAAYGGDYIKDGCDFLADYNSEGKYGSASLAIVHDVELFVRLVLVACCSLISFNAYELGRHSVWLFSSIWR